jgi:flagellar hook assembly protein FlgD
VRVDVYDIVGRHVRTVAQGTLAAGLHEWRWAGADDAGRLLPAGLYHVRARVDGVASSRTIVRLR